MTTIGIHSEQTEERLTTSEAAGKELPDQKVAFDQPAIVAVTDVHGTSHLDSTGDSSLTILLGKAYAT